MNIVHQTGRALDTHAASQPDGGILCILSFMRLMGSANAIQRICRNPVIELCIEPLSGLLMLGEGADGGVDEEIGVNEDHFEGFAFGERKHVRDVIERFRCGNAQGLPLWSETDDAAPGGLLSCFRPRRRASFTNTFRLSSRLRRKRSKAAATSSSSVSVVLMRLSIRIISISNNERDPDHTGTSNQRGSASFPSATRQSPPLQRWHDGLWFMMRPSYATPPFSFSSARVGPGGGRCHMFGSDPDPDQPGWDPGQEPKTREELKKQRRRERAGAT